MSETLVPARRQLRIDDASESHNRHGSMGEACPDHMAMEASAPQDEVSGTVKWLAKILRTHPGNLYARHDNPVLVAVVAVSPLFTNLPFALAVYGYYTNFKPALFSLSIVEVFLALAVGYYGMSIHPANTDKDRLFQCMLWTDVAVFVMSSTMPLLLESMDFSYMPAQSKFAYCGLLAFYCITHLYQVAVLIHSKDDPRFKHSRVYWVIDRTFHGYDALTDLALASAMWITIKENGATINSILLLVSCLFFASADFLLTALSIFTKVFETHRFRKYLLVGMGLSEVGILITTFFAIRQEALAGRFHTTGAYSQQTYFLVLSVVVTVISTGLTVHELPAWFFHPLKTLKAYRSRNVVAPVQSNTPEKQLSLLGEADCTVATL